jgi:hypothetical protein
VLAKCNRDRGRSVTSNVVLAVGIGLGTALYFLVPGQPVYLVALVPGLVGVVLLAGALRAQV